MITDIITALLLAGDLTLSFFVGYLYFWLLVSLRYAGRRNAEAPGCKKFAIIVPAHNEELVIENLLRSAKALDYPGECLEMIVIADNCTDRTEEIVTQSGMSCLVRTDPERRGKPYALQWAFQQIDLQKYDAFVIIDADTTIDPKFLKSMNLALHEGHEIIQGYLGILNPDETWLTRLMVIPGVLKYRYRYRGKKRLGFSCPLMGNGMCFARRVITQYGWDALSLTENWEYYIKSVLRGIFPTYEEAYIYSLTADTTQRGRTQRERWLKGRLECIRGYFWHLLKAAVTKRDLRILDCAVELILPSISMLANLSGLQFILSIVHCFWVRAIYPSVAWAALLPILITSYFVFGAAASQPSRKTWFSLLRAPIFLSWKFLLTIRGFATRRETGWRKTERTKK